MKKEEALEIIKDDRSLNRFNIIELGWSHFSNFKTRNSESDIFVIRDYNTPQNLHYSLIDLWVLWRKDSTAEIMIGFNNIYGGEEKSEAQIIDDNENLWADCVINRLFELRLLMQMCEINHFLNSSNN